MLNNMKTPENQSKIERDIQTERKKQRQTDRQRVRQRQRQRDRGTECSYVSNCLIVFVILWRNEQTGK